MNRLDNSNIPAIFNDIVKKLEHKYPTKFLSLNYTLRKYSFSNSRFAIPLFLKNLETVTPFLSKYSSLT